MNSEPKKSLNNETSTIQMIQKIGNSLKQLISRTDSENINLFLNKSLRYINSAISNESLEEHFASSQLLKSASKNLENFLNDDEQSVSQLLDNDTKQVLRDLITNLKLNSENIEKLNFIDLDSSGTDHKSDTQEDSNENNSDAKASGNIANDWILSDFNLNTNDFKSELALITGSLLDLDFTYQLSKVINPNCLLMKDRADQNNDSKKYILKVYLYSFL